MTIALALFCLAAGAGILLYWAVARRAGWEERPREWSAHLAAELLLAAGLVAGGAGLLAEGWDARVPAAAALGGLLYAVVNVSGFFAQRGDRAMRAGMAVQAVLTAVALTIVLAGPG